MSNLNISALKDSQTELICGLYNIHNSKDQFTKIRSQYYKVTADLYYAKKKAKLEKKFARGKVVPMAMKNNLAVLPA
jgi:hypothetical protein